MLQCSKFMYKLTAIHSVFYLRWYNIGNNLIECVKNRLRFESHPPKHWVSSVKGKLHYARLELMIWRWYKEKSTRSVCVWNVFISKIRSLEILQMNTPNKKKRTSKACPNVCKVRDLCKQCDKIAIAWGTFSWNKLSLDLRFIVHFGVNSNLSLISQFFMFFPFIFKWTSSCRNQYM